MRNSAERMTRVSRFGVDGRIAIPLTFGGASPAPLPWSLGGRVTIRLALRIRE
jgi:hypothetical protein